MELKDLKQQVLAANLELVEKGLVTYTWGNVSGIDRDRGLVAIKPSGVAYDDLSVDQIVVLNLADGSVVEGDLNPSSDTPTHLILYQTLPSIGGITHTHSPYATSFAQAAREIPCFGTTHADYFYGTVPLTRQLTADEIAGDYEVNTGKVITELWGGKEDKSLEMPAVLVFQHGPFTWGKDAGKSVEAAVVLEEVAKMAFQTTLLNPEKNQIEAELLDKHFLRKHGDNAYYGQQ